MLFVPPLLLLLHARAPLLPWRVPDAAIDAWAVWNAAASVEWFCAALVLCFRVHAHGLRVRVHGLRVRVHVLTSWP